MQAKPYPEAKRRILVEQSPKDFTVFLVKIRCEEGKQFIREKLLPNQVPGFRPGRTPLSLTVSRLIAKLKNEQELTNPNSHVWNLFSDAWKFWVESHTEVNEILLEFDNGADFDENDECITPPNSELDIKCFQFLLGANCNTSIHQEMIRRFYEFGYFNKDERIENLINQFSSLKEIEHRQRLPGLPNEIDELSRTVNKLSQTVENLNSLFSTKQSIDKLEQQLIQQIAEVSQSFGQQLQKLEQKIERMNQSFDTRLSKVETKGVGQMVKQPGMAKVLNRINQFETRLSAFEKSVKSIKTKPTITELTNSIESKINRLIDQQAQDRIKQIDTQMAAKIKSLEDKFDKTSNIISGIQAKKTDGPRVASQALQIGRHYNVQLQAESEHYSDEHDYLWDFTSNLRKCGMTDSEEVAKAIHIAMKAFPVLEIADARLMRVWRVMCNNHLFSTTINVEMGWLGSRDWFPDLFAENCFKERLERSDLEVSIRKMLELGDMPWMIYFRNCDRSFPESYLPNFIDWIRQFCKAGVILFLIRCSGTNCCKTNEDFYEQVARLPKPQHRKPIEKVNLKDARIPLTLSEWDSWCQPKPETESQYQKYYRFLENLRSAIENRGVQIPIELLREIQHYLQLSHNIMMGAQAFDWALTLRLLPWIGNRHRLIDAALNLVNDENEELPRFQEELRIAREADE